MQNAMAWVWGVIIATILLGGAYYLLASPQDTTTNVTVQGNNETTGGSTATATPAAGSSGGGSGTSVTVDGEIQTSLPAESMSATVTYNGSSFSPRTVTIARGGTVSWKNQSGSSMWVASDHHPTHTIYSGTSRSEHCPDAGKTAFDQCQGGGDFTFTFDKTGTWGYHDHINASAVGTVIVQ